MSIICMVVTLQLFNVSFDPADPHWGTEDLSINEVESCIELVLEIVMDKEDAVKESDESDEAPGKPGTTVVLFSVSGSCVLVENSSIFIKSYQSTFSRVRIESPNIPITSPPPKLT